jgi:integrase/recombinase XerD
LAPDGTKDAMESRFKLWKDESKAKGARCWRVRVPADLSESGKVERRFFTTKLEAQGFIQAQTTRLHNEGNGGPKLTPAQREIADKAFLRIQVALPGASDAVLLQAVDAYLAAHNRRSRSKTFLDAYQQWQAATEEKIRNGQPTSDKYRRQMKYSLPRFKPLHEKLVCDITPEDVDATLAGAVAAGNRYARNGLMRVLRACLTWCLAYEWLDKVPVQSKRHSVDIGQRQPEVLTPAQVGSLLAACAQTDPELLGYYVIALFAGVRPNDELAELKWENVFAGEGDAIHVPETVAKTGRARYVPILPTLKAWLKYINPPQFGPVVPLQATRNPSRPQKLEWRVNWITKRRKAVQRAAGIDPWPKNVMRHTYASYWMTIHRDEDRCRDAMGHRTKDQLVKHYRKHTTVKDAEAFWALTPEAVLKTEHLEVVA